MTQQKLGFSAKRLWGVLALLLCAIPAIGQPPLGIEGTWRLTARELADGRVLRPPQVVGLLSLSSGFRNMNVAWKDSSGKWSFHSVVTSYRLSAAQYTETLLFSAYHNSINGEEVHYSGGAKSQTVPLTTKVGTIVIPVPWGEPVMTFEGDRMSSKREGAFIDRWERIDRRDKSP